METQRTLISRDKYGKVHLTLKELLDEREITRYRLSEDSGTRFEVIRKWCRDDVEKLDLDVLARICYVLQCDVSDILHYEETPEPPEEENQPDGQPPVG